MAGSVALMRLLDATLVAYAVHGVAAFSDVGGIAAWCRVNRIPRATLYRHLARIRESGSWEPLSRAPKSHRNATDPVLVAAILGLRDRLGADNGAVTIGCHLTRDPALAGERIPCPATIHKILVRHGRVVPEPKKKPRSAWRRFAYARPRDCYQIDATNVALADGAKVVVFEVLDDATRMLVATRAAMAETAAGAIEAITAAFTDFGVPAIVLSDNGTAFTARSTGPGKSRFTRLVTGHGARLIHSSPYHPQTGARCRRAPRATRRRRPGGRSRPRLSPAGRRRRATMPASLRRRTRCSVAAGERPTIRASSTFGRSASVCSSASSWMSTESSEMAI